MQYTANTTCSYDRRAIIQHELEKASEWSRKPMTGRAQCVAAAIAGSFMFIVFVAAYMMR